MGTRTGRATLQPLGEAGSSGIVAEGEAWGLAHGCWDWKRDNQPCLIGKCFRNFRVGFAGCRRPADPRLCRCSGPVRWGVATCNLKAISAMLPVFIAGCLLSCCASSKAPHCAWDPGWELWDAQVCPLLNPPAFVKEGGLPEPAEACRSSSCRVLRCSGYNGLRLHTGS